MHCFSKRCKSSRQYSRHVLKVDNYFTSESRFDMMIRTLETLIYDCSNSTSNGPPKKKPVSKVGGLLAKLGGQDPPTPQWLRPWSNKTALITYDVRSYSFVLVWSN